jgi:hypothetical protein
VRPQGHVSQDPAEGASSEAWRPTRALCPKAPARCGCRVAWPDRDATPHTNTKQRRVGLHECFCGAQCPANPVLLSRRGQSPAAPGAPQPPDHPHRRRPHPPTLRGARGKSVGISKVGSSTAKPFPFSLFLFPFSHFHPQPQGCVSCGSSV